VSENVLARAVPSVLAARSGPSRSLIAGANALMRMKETTRPDGVLRDRWAGQLADDHLLVQAVRFGRFLLPPLWLAIDELQTAHCVRHRAIDELVLRAVGEGFRQVVVVGAGYDMRPSRFARQLAGVRWIELDLPAIGARKRERVDALEGVSDTVEYAPIDLRTQTLATALARTSFRPDQPACFVIEGLIHYLPRARVESLLSELASGPGARRAVLSFIRPEVYAQAGGFLRTLVQVLREIPRLCFSPDELAKMARDHGFSEVRSWTFAEQVEAFAPSARGRRVGASQDVAELSYGMLRNLPRTNG
jgi:methyltransferase (TIGR00027 family)